MSMKLLILGLLLERDMHPYEITLVMKERSMDQIIKLQMGSLYYAVDKLAEGGHIETVEVIRSPDRPDKTIYRITDKGKELMEQLILQQIKKSDPPYHPLYMALALSRYIDQEKVAKLLEERIREAEHQVNFAYQVYEEHISLVPRSSLHLMYGRYEHCLTELKWLKRLYDDVVAGKMSDKGSPIIDP
ncbi:PadR family transcriptional regulator [Paenibacillus tritici]|uniref:PadR family transcriptional regulator n=1 Tax=Paenibacillus tritici TaxID=1873425 RepID=A0ABX2DRQ1_9BACL|nr:PadR family transcriptional regulator [Paenibacillus tritici]NQX46744.1 PadR family transcriptional regulator [Paenibacillus tritici]QUL55386.1 PadR family transcriptional regulator [Paenibacillus tritici]